MLTEQIAYISDQNIKYSFEFSEQKLKTTQKRVTYLKNSTTTTVYSSSTKTKNQYWNILQEKLTIYESYMIYVLKLIDIGIYLSKFNLLG